MNCFTEEIFNEATETGTKLGRALLEKGMPLEEAEAFCEEAILLLYPGQSERQQMMRNICDTAAGYTFVKQGEQMSIKEFTEMQVRENLRRALDRFIGEDDD